MLGTRWAVRLERLARVDFPPPYRKIFVWSWSEVAVLSSRAGTPNLILEHEIRGSDPQELRAAFEQLSGWARQETQHQLRM